jgi:hypothetical protein
MALGRNPPAQHRNADYEHGLRSRNPLQEFIGAIEASIERNNRTRARTLSVSLAPDRTGGSHILAYAHTEEQQRDSPLIGSHDEILAKMQTLSAVAVEYVMLNAAGSRTRSCRI